MMPGCKLEVWDHGSGLEVSIVMTIDNLDHLDQNNLDRDNLDDDYHNNNGTKDALKEEKKGFNDGDYKNMKDL